MCWHFWLSIQQWAPHTGPSHAHMSGPYSGQWPKAPPTTLASGAQLANPSDTNVPFWAAQLGNNQDGRWRQKHTWSQQTEGREELVQRHEDANQAAAKHYGVLLERVKALEESQGKLQAENERLVRDMAALAQTVEGLTQTVVRMQDQIQPTEKALATPALARPSKAKQVQ